MAPCPCTHCSKNVTAASKALECHWCKKWTHIRCCEIGEDLYRNLMSYHRLNLNFCCDSCVPKMESARDKEVPPSQCSADESSEVDSPDVTCIVRQLSPATEIPKPITSTPVKHRRRKRRNKKNKSDADVKEAEPEVPTLRPVVEVLPKTMKSTSDTRRPARERCLIVLNVPESLSDTPQARVDHDVKSLRDCLISIFDEDEQDVASSIKLTMAFRLGKRRDNPELNPRPLKIVLNSPDEVQTVIRRAHKLKGQPVRILRDLSPEDRIKLKTALDELRERRANGEMNLFVKDFRVVKRKPRVRWSPLLLTSNPQVSGTPGLQN